MTERAGGEHEADPYYQHDVAIGEGQVQGEPYTIRMRLHEKTERFWEREELIPLKTKRPGTRIYFHGRPYILVPRITLTLATYPTPKPSGAIGEVVGSEGEGMEHREIGQAQGWAYPLDRTVVVWEAYLHDWARQEDPTKDKTLAAVWTGFERFLLERLTTVERIVTPSFEPIYGETPGVWHEFLEARGYRQVNERAFLKEVAHP